MYLWVEGYKSLNWRLRKWRFYQTVCFRGVFCTMKKKLMNR